MTRKLYVLSVRDSALSAFASPFVAPTHGMAVRSFRDEVNRSESVMYKHPDDYELYCVGMFDEDSGMLEPQVPSLLSRAKDMKE